MKRNIVTVAALLALPIWAFAADDKKPYADNSGKNERDGDNKTLTPGDQSEKPEDRKLTHAIRQSVNALITGNTPEIKIGEKRGPVNHMLQPPQG